MRDKIHFQKDLEYGLSKEEILLETLRRRFPNINRTENKYEHYDYDSPDCIVELKSRRVYKNTYPDTMIGCNKILSYKDDEREAFAVFNFIDGVYYYPITKESLEFCRFSIGGRCDRGCYEYNDYCYIPCDLLTKIE
jgi:hypothetical protein